MKQSTQRDMGYDGGWGDPDSDPIRDILYDISNLDVEDFQDFYEKFQDQFKVIIRKEKLISLK
jgi:hypothetical protein